MNTDIIVKELVSLIIPVQVCINDCLIVLPLSSVVLVVLLGKVLYSERNNTHFLFNINVRVPVY